MLRCCRLSIAALLLITGVHGAVALGTGVLVPGNPPLTSAMVNDLAGFFEWALDGRLSPLQRDQLGRIVAEEWRKQEPASIQNYVRFMQLPSQLSSMSDAQRRQLHQQMQAGLLDLARKQPENPVAQIVLAVRGVGEGAAPSVAARATGVSGGSDLIGIWQAGTVAATTFRDRTTGAYSAPSGTQVRYRLMPDGRYEYVALTQQSMYNCTTKLLTYKVGVLQVQGDTLTFVPQSGKFTSEDNCNAHNNYEKPVKMERETFRWHIERDQYGTKLCLQNQSINGCAYKQ